MVNPFSDLAYRSSTGLSHEFADERRCDRREYNLFVPALTMDLPDREFEANEEGALSALVAIGMASLGVISAERVGKTSTDTNRNRARARWTYFHFLGGYRDSAGDHGPCGLGGFKQSDDE